MKLKLNHNYGWPAYQIIFAKDLGEKGETIFNKKTENKTKQQKTGKQRNIQF